MWTATQVHALHTFPFTQTCRQLQIGCNKFLFIECYMILFWDDWERCFYIQISILGFSERPRAAPNITGDLMMEEAREVVVCWHSVRLPLWSSDVCFFVCVCVHSSLPSCWALNSMGAWAKRCVPIRLCWTHLLHTQTDHQVLFFLQGDTPSLFTGLDWCCLL